MTGWLRKIGGGGIAALLAVSLAASAIGYRIFGSGAELPAADPDPLALLEARTEAEPGNSRAWQEVGFAYFELGRYAEAAAAYERALRADPESAVLWSSLGEARVMASERDPMPSAALAAFRRAARLDPKDPRARYFVAVEKDLAGDHEAAIDDWLALLAETPAGAPWDADLRRTIEQVGAINRIAVDQRIAVALEARSTVPAVAQAGIPGPTPEQIAAASALRPAEQQAMAEEMVWRLAARLASQPADVDGWIMLMRSYRMLGRDGEARAALRTALEANPGSRAQLEAAASTLGID